MRKFNLVRNKKGQEGIASIPVLIAIVIAIAIGIAVIALIFRGSTSVTETVYTIAPSQISTFVQGCRFYLSTEDSNSYCQNFKLIQLVSTKDGSSISAYINCQHPDVIKGLQNLKLNPNSMTCDPNEAQIYCNKVKYTLASNEILSVYDPRANNIFSCINSGSQGATCLSLKGQWVQGPSCPSQLPNLIPMTSITDTDLATRQAQSQICCSATNPANPTAPKNCGASQNSAGNFGDWKTGNTCPQGTELLAGPFSDTHAGSVCCAITTGN